MLGGHLAPVGEDTCDSDLPPGDVGSVATLGTSADVIAENNYRDPSVLFPIGGSTSIAMYDVVIIAMDLRSISVASYFCLGFG